MMPNGEFLVVASQDGQIQALDAHNGSFRWTQSRDHPFAGFALVQVTDEVVAAAQQAGLEFGQCADAAAPIGTGEQASTWAIS